MNIKNYLKIEREDKNNHSDRKEEKIDLDFEEVKYFQN